MDEMWLVVDVGPAKGDVALLNVFGIVAVVPPTLEQFGEGFRAVIVMDTPLNNDGAVSIFVTQSVGEILERLSDFAP